ncbi:response regulator [Pedobacter sp. MC2016-05]|uniref:response regulator transcription factor n=1 Tax=Pedobacter sp. MC2016-05 TaxID=2994474 RepID=UPI0022459326|nr:response regulator [Pedobacter sp. MC2016-05]MCX2475297.1 response regulator [Pedobacter sp. MC2016-05]
MAKRIIVLEDDEGIRDVMHLILSMEDYDTTSYDSVNAFKNRESIQPDLFILDVMLPDGNGIDVCRDLKGLNHVTPILMMSANASRKDIEQGCAADGFIEKPFGINQVLDKVRSLIEGIN